MKAVNSMEKAIELAKKNVTGKIAGAELDNSKKTANELIETCGIAMVGSISDAGFPNVKAMLKCETDGLKTMWFSTNTSSKRVSQFKQDPRACVYFVDEKDFKGLMLVGEMQVLNDHESRSRLWKEGCEIYYPQGIDDPDYSVLKFTAKWGNYYHGLKNVSFEI
jgi:general stress protein 26